MKNSLRMPHQQDYVQAIRQPEQCFYDDALRDSKFVAENAGSADRTPQIYRGKYALTIPFTSSLLNRVAVRLFLEFPHDMQVRYQAIERYIQTRRPQYLVGTEYHEQGIYINNSWYPLVLMEWVQGDTLAKYLETNRSPAEIEQLRHHIYDLGRYLASSDFAHGDLHHGNIIIHRNKLQLVDYDAMYVPELDNLTARESGHDNYQHPDRRRTSHFFNSSLDNFSLIAIYLSLIAIEHNPRAYEPKSDAIFLRAQDYAAPAHSERLQTLRQLGLYDAVELFTNICNRPLEEVPTLHEFLGRAKLTRYAPQVNVFTQRLGCVACFTVLDPKDTRVGYSRKITCSTCRWQYHEACWTGQCYRCQGTTYTFGDIPDVIELDAGDVQALRGFTVSHSEIDDIVIDPPYVDLSIQHTARIHVINNTAESIILHPRQYAPWFFIQPLAVKELSEVIRIEPHQNTFITVGVHIDHPAYVRAEVPMNQSRLICDAFHEQAEHRPMFLRIFLFGLFHVVALFGFLVSGQAVLLLLSGLLAGRVAMLWTSTWTFSAYWLLLDLTNSVGLRDLFFIRNQHMFLRGIHEKVIDNQGAKAIRIRLALYVLLGSMIPGGLMYAVMFVVMRLTDVTFNTLYLVLASLFILLYGTILFRLYRRLLETTGSSYEPNTLRSVLLYPFQQRAINRDDS